MKPHFLISRATILDREKVVDNVYVQDKESGDPVALQTGKREELTIQIDFISSGNTKSITAEEIIDQVLSKLERIE